MKNINTFIAAIIMLAALPACEHENNSFEPKGTVQFFFENEVDGASLQTGTLIYTNEAGNIYSVDKLMYYISNMTFIRNDGFEYKAPENYELIDEAKEESKQFTITDIPGGEYTTLRFYMGIDSVRSFSGAQEGDLSGDFGMLWDWQTGYIYLKHEGLFIDSTGSQNALLYHYGKLKALVQIEIPIVLKVTSSKRKVTIAFNLNEIYRSPNTIDFNGNNIHQSTSAADMIWVELIKQNFQEAFEVEKVE